MIAPLTVGSLFSGIGGLDLGLERAGMRVVFQVEKDTYATRVLARHWPDVPRFRNVQTVGATTLPACDVLAGGFPCQDISVAGTAAGLGGARSGLWSEFSRLVGELRPRYVLVENVSALTHRGLDRILAELTTFGYDAEWQPVPASAFGAPHERERLFVVAYPHGTGQRQQWGASAIQTAQFALECRRWWASEPPVGRVVYGLPRRVDRLRGLGNAVVPQVAEYVGRLIVAHAEGP